MGSRARARAAGPRWESARCPQARRSREGPGRDPGAWAPSADPAGRPPHSAVRARRNPGLGANLAVATKLGAGPTQALPGAADRGPPLLTAGAGSPGWDAGCLGSREPGAASARPAEPRWPGPPSRRLRAPADRRRTRAVSGLWREGTPPCRSSAPRVRSPRFI